MLLFLQFHLKFFFKHSFAKFLLNFKFSKILAIILNFFFKKQNKIHIIISTKLTGLFKLNFSKKTFRFSIISTKLIEFVKISKNIFKISIFFFFFCKILIFLNNFNATDWIFIDFEKNSTNIESFLNV